MLFIWSSQLEYETLLHHFFNILKCDGVQFVCGAPLVHCYKDSRCIGKLTLALFLLVLISKHLVAFIQVLQQV